MTNKIERVSVFCGANTGNKEIYTTETRLLGKYLVDQNINLVFGGGKVGLMGVIADSVLENGGEVIGVIPNFLSHKEIEHPSCTQLIRVETMHERKMQMFKFSDGAIALPGGFGTFDEVFELLTWGQLGLHSFPIAFLNINSYYDDLQNQVNKMHREGFLKKDFLDMIIIEEDIETLIDKMKNFVKPESEKWINLERT